MKHIKLFEELKKFYSGEEINQQSYYWFVVTEDENFAISHLDSEGYSEGRIAYPLKNTENIAKYYKNTSFESEKAAKDFIKHINSSPDGYKGQDEDGTIEIDLKVVKAEWDANELPYKGYLEFESPGWGVAFKKQYPDVISHRGDWYLGDLKFKDDLHNRYSEYRRFRGSEKLYTNLKGKLKVVKYTIGMLRQKDDLFKN